MHRDLKPHNVFLGDGDTIKIGDFGVSRQLSSSRDMAQTVVGSPGYLSPELCNGEPYNEKTDVWAFGVTISEMCALKHPFGDAASQAALVMKIMRAKPPQLPPHYSPQLVRMLFCCMQRLPAHRPSALQLLSLSTVQQHAARLELIASFPPAALRAGAKRAEPPPPHPTSYARSSSHSGVELQFPHGHHTDDRPRYRGADGDRAAHGRRQGDPPCRNVSGRQSGAPQLSEETMREGAGPWDLKPVCAGRQRASQGTRKTWQTAEPFPSVDDDASSDGELGPPAEASRATAARKAWMSSVQNADKKEGGAGTDGGPSGCSGHGSDAGGARHASHPEHAAEWHAPPQTPPAGLWAKRRGASPSPVLPGKLQLLSLNNSGWEELASPLDAFARHHCPVVQPRSDAVGIPFAAFPDNASPLNNLVRQNFPARSSACDDLNPPRAVQRQSSAYDETSQLQRRSLPPRP